MHNATNCNHQVCLILDVGNCRYDHPFTASNNGNIIVKNNVTRTSELQEVLTGYPLKSSKLTTTEYQVVHVLRIYVALNSDMEWSSRRRNKIKVGSPQPTELLLK